VGGHERFKAGAWRLTVNTKDPVTGKRKPVHATVHAPNNKRGDVEADSELAKIIIQVETGRTMPTSGMTEDQLIERYILDRSPSWAPGADEETRKRVAQHITPDVGSIAIERLRPVDVQELHAVLRAAGLSEGSIGERAGTDPRFRSLARLRRSDPGCELDGRRPLSVFPRSSRSIWRPSR
jgi:hypothetical protein